MAYTSHAQREHEPDSVVPRSDDKARHSRDKETPLLYNEDTPGLSNMELTRNLRLKHWSSSPIWLFSTVALLLLLFIQTAVNGPNPGYERGFSTDIGEPPKSARSMIPTSLTLVQPSSSQQSRPIRSASEAPSATTRTAPCGQFANWAPHASRVRRQKTSMPPGTT